MRLTSEVVVEKNGCIEEMKPSECIKSATNCESVGCNYLESAIYGDFLKNQPINLGVGMPKCVGGGERCRCMIAKNPKLWWRARRFRRRRRSATMEYRTGPPTEGRADHFLWNRRLATSYDQTSPYKEGKTVHFPWTGMAIIGVRCITPGNETSGTAKWCVRDSRRRNWSGVLKGIPTKGIIHLPTVHDMPSSFS